MKNQTTHTTTHTTTPTSLTDASLTDKEAIREDTLNRLLAQLIFLEKRLTPIKK